jgi:hypothetical protein
MGEIVEAIKKLQGPIYPNYLREDTCSLLSDFVAKHQFKKSATSYLPNTPDGITITSSLPNLDSIFMSNDDLQDLTSFPEAMKTPCTAK